MKIKKNIFFFWGGGVGSGGGGRVGGQGRWEWRSEAFEKIGCERRSVAFVKIHKKKKMGGGVRSGVGVGEVARLGVGGDVGYGGCKPRIKGIDKCK